MVVTRWCTLNRKFVFEAGRLGVGWKCFFWGFVVAVWLDWLGWRADYAVGGEVTYANVAMMMAGALTNFVCGSLWCLNDENLDFELAGCASAGGGADFRLQRSMLHWCGRGIRWCFIVVHSRGFADGFD